MKSEVNQSMGRLRFVLLGVLWLTVTSLSGQDADAPATNVVAETNAVAPADAAEPASDIAVTNVTKTPEPSWNRGRRQDDAMVVIGNDAEVRAGDERDAVVVVFGNANIKGKVRDAAVAILGDMNVSGYVGDAVTAVLGNVQVSGEAGDVVAVLGNVDLEDGAVIKGDVVSVGGKINKSPNARVEGEIVNPVDLGGLGLPQIEWIKSWFVHCVVKLRPLAPQVGWVWFVAGAFLLFYVLVAIALPRPVQSCVGELTRRPITSFFLGMLTLPLTLIVCLILAITGIGLIVVVFLLPALLFAGLVGKVALLEHLGDSIRRATGAANAFGPLVALLVGTVLITLLYLIPVLGLITFAVTGLWGLGAAVSATFGGMKRENPQKPVPPATLPPAAAATSGFAPAPMPVTTAPTESTFAANPGVAAPSDPNPAAQPFATATPPVSPAPTTVPEALAHPRAGFFERMGAAFLDIVIVSILVGVVNNVGFGFFHRPPFGLLVALAYFAGMWAWKSTTVGGIILNLKVVRLDNQPVTFVVALVRGLAAALSVIVLFLGFLWIAWDKDKQGWHDRIAGTVVVRLPRGTPLVVL
jgi:uncharacterized RDD family membrane protein YckC